MLKVLLIIAFIAISIYSETQKVKRAKQQAAGRQKPREPAQEDYEDDVEDEEQEEQWQPQAQTVHERVDEVKALLEKAKREHEEWLARADQERRLRDEAERARRAFEAQQQAESLATQQCVEQRSAQPAKPGRHKKRPSAQVEEGVRSTADTPAAVDSDGTVGFLTPADARRAVILDAIFNRPQF